MTDRQITIGHKPHRDRVSFPDRSQQMQELARAARLLLREVDELELAAVHGQCVIRGSDGEFRPVTSICEPGKKALRLALALAEAP